jgi:hypothetical protein
MENNGTATKDAESASQNFQANLTWWKDAGTATWALVVVGVVGSFLGLWTLCTLIRQTEASEAAAKAAFANAQVIINAERAWIDIAALLPIDASGKCKLQMLNRGRTVVLPTKTGHLN